MTEENLSNIPKPVPIFTDWGTGKDFDLNFDKGDMAKAPHKLRVDKATGSVGLSLQLLKEIKHIISYPLLCCSRNLSMSQLFQMTGNV